MTSHTTNTRTTARWLAASVIAVGIGTAIATGSAVVSADTHDSDTQQQISQQQTTGGVVPEPPSTARKNTTSSNIEKKFSQTSDLITGNMK